MKTVCEVLGVARSNVTVRARAPVANLGRPPQPDADLVDEIKTRSQRCRLTAIVGSGLFCGARPTGADTMFGG
jgi:hypothetical protein